MLKHARHEEFHVTVTGDPIRWHAFCTDHGIKPLYIELNNFERQLMCAVPYDPSPAIKNHGAFVIVRLKYEVQVAPSMHEPGAKYYEVHCKLDGPFMPGEWMASRDLYRDERWYITERKPTPFEPADFAAMVYKRYPSQYVEFEYEAAIVDTNPWLDRNWTFRHPGF